MRLQMRALEPTPTMLTTQALRTPRRVVNPIKLLAVNWTQQREPLSARPLALSLAIRLVQLDRVLELILELVPELVPKVPRKAQTHVPIGHAGWTVYRPKWWIESKP